MVYLRLGVEHNTFKKWSIVHYTLVVLIKIQKIKRAHKKFETNFHFSMEMYKQDNYQHLTAHIFCNSLKYKLKNKEFIIFLVKGM